MAQRIRDDVQRQAQGVGGFEALAVEFLGLLLDGFAHGWLAVGRRGQPVIRLRFNPRCLRQNLQHLLRASPARPAVDVGIGIRNGNALGLLAFLFVGFAHGWG